jgi:hypothetical protein
MLPSDYQTIVRSVSGTPELRRVTEIQEWRVERQLGADGVVVSVVVADGSSHSFLLASADATDMGDVLQRQTRA